MFFKIMNPFTCWYAKKIKAFLSFHNETSLQSDPDAKKHNFQTGSVYNVLLKNKMNGKSSQKIT